MKKTWIRPRMVLSVRLCVNDLATFKQDEHSLNILITEYHGEKQTFTAYKTHIDESLTALLGCKVKVIVQHSMMSECYVHLNLSNSVELPMVDTLKNRDKLYTIY